LPISFHLRRDITERWPRLELVNHITEIEGWAVIARVKTNNESAFTDP